MRITSNQAKTGHIEKYIGSAYDNVKLVANSIDAINDLAETITDGVDLELLAQVLQNLGDSVSDLARIATADLVLISEDLSKGNYLGNRKLDIDLNLNNNSTEIEVTYQGITLVSNQGVILQIDFTQPNPQGGAPIITELASYTAIYNALIAGINQFNSNEPNEQLHIRNTEMDIINSTLPHLPTMIRIRDLDGYASNIDRLRLQVYSGDAKEVNPAYYWAKTTSALQTLSNRVGDIIRLGNDIDSIIQISILRDEIEFIYENRDELIENPDSIYNHITKLVRLFESIDGLDGLYARATELDYIFSVRNELVDATDSIWNMRVALNTLYSNITEIAAVGTNINDVVTVANELVVIQNVSDNIQAVIDAYTHALNAAQSATNALASEQAALTYRNEAQTARNTAQTLVQDLQSIGVANTITAVTGTPASVTYNNSTNRFTFVIPQGPKGDKGDAYTVNAVGLISERSVHDGQVKGFSFLAVDEGNIYFKLSNASGNWSSGVGFGKGDTGATGADGNSITGVAPFSTTNPANVYSVGGFTDTYRISYSDGTTSTFNIYNGNGIASVSLSSTTATSGLPNQDGETDTYTMSFTNGTVFNFSIYNGQERLIDSVQGRTGNVVITATDVGLGNVDNTSDINKPISTATQDALDLKADTTDLTSAINNQIGTIQNFEDALV